MVAPESSKRKRVLLFVLRVAVEDAVVGAVEEDEPIAEPILVVAATVTRDAPLCFSFTSSDWRAAAGKILGPSGSDGCDATGVAELVDAFIDSCEFDGRSCDGATVAVLSI